MDPINSINQLMAALRRQMAERGERSSRSSDTASSSAARKSTPRQSTKASLEKIQRRIGQRLQHLQADERRGSPGTQIFIESILAWEFGEDVLTDPRFGDLVANVRETMAEDPALQQNLERLLDKLAVQSR